ncbi:LysR substrate-binding domain-containing protein [Vibrio mimicus]|uniref:LysR substrate-binding domain-containing protein n=1 Tax=Vibrio mimicus TaxID=674 RepID=UPI00307A58DD
MLHIRFKTAAYLNCAYALGKASCKFIINTVLYVNVLPPGKLRAGLFQALEQQHLKREVAVSVTHFLAVPEMLAVTDYCATLPKLIGKSLERDPRLKILPAPVDLGTFPVQMGWHVRYRHDPAHKWLRSMIDALAKEITSKTE